MNSVLFPLICCLTSFVLFGFFWLALDNASTPTGPTSPEPAKQSLAAKALDWIEVYTAWSKAKTIGRAEQVKRSWMEDWEDQGVDDDC